MLRTSGLRLRGAGWCGVWGEVDGFEGVGAAEADGGVSGVVAYVFGEAPAAFAFAAGGGFGPNVEGSLFHVAFGDDGVGDVDLGYAEELGKDAVVTLEDGVGMAGDGVEPADGDLDLAGTVADLFGGAGFFEDLYAFFPERPYWFPAFFDHL